MIFKKIICLKTSLVSFFAGFLCMAAFRIIGSEIDEQGYLYEPFALIPIGYFFIFLGTAIGIIYLSKLMFDKMKSIKKRFHD